MYSTKLIICGALLFMVGSSLTMCVVDDSKPDLRMFNLKHVNASVEQLEARSNRPIGDYATGAIAMRKSLFSEDSQARCSAYAHLLKLVHRTNFDTDMEIKMDTVLAIAIVADAEREMYTELLKAYKAGQVKEIFKEAIEQLERLHIQTPVSRDAWLELTDCAAQFDLNLASFLEKPRRAEQIARYREFNAPESSRRQTSTGEPQVRVFGEKEIRDAHKMVELFDDEELKRLRSELHERVQQSRKQPEVPAVEVTAPSGQDGALEQDAPAENGEIKLELTIPNDETNNKQPQQQQPALSSAELDETLIKHNLAMMNFVKRWYQSLEKASKGALEHRRKLSVDSAMDFKTHWNHLKSLKLDPTSELGARVQAFLSDAENKRVARRMFLIAENYVRVVEMMATMLKRKNRYNSMAELEQKYERIITLLKRTDPLVDIHFITQAALNSRLREYNEYKAINNFIERDMW